MNIIIVWTLAFIVAQVKPDDDGVIRARLLHPATKQHLDKRGGQFNASLFNNKRVHYLVQVDIGTPPQKFTVSLDTGSSDLWVPSTNCPVTTCPLKRFDTTLSSTFKPLDKAFRVRYALGNASGTYVKDTVSIGGAVIPNQRLALASTTQRILAFDKNNGMETNGVLGLGYPLAAGAEPLVFSLATKGVIQEPVFSIFLNSVREPDYAGELILGGIDSTKFNGNLTYLPVVPTGLGRHTSSSFYLYWMVYAHGFRVISDSQQQHQQHTFQNVGAFILDTGASLTFLPSSLAAQVVDAMVGPGNYQRAEGTSGVYMVNCSVAQQQHRFELLMLQDHTNRTNPVVVSVPISELVIPMDTESTETATKCIFGIASSEHLGRFGSGDMYLIGDSVLRSMYMVFDMGKNRVGLAASRGVGGDVFGGDASFQALRVAGKPIQLASSGAMALSNTFLIFFFIIPVLFLFN